MTNSRRTVGFWLIVLFLLYDLATMLMGQTASLFSYDFTVRLGLQESRELVGVYGVQVNRAFGLADTMVAIPLILISLAGLAARKRWALTTLSAFMGLTLYWPVTCAGMLIFLNGVPGFNLTPGLRYWTVFALHTAMAAWTLLYVTLRGNSLTGES